MYVIVDCNKTDTAKDKYIQVNGKHFNKELCAFAVSLMFQHNTSTGEVVDVEKLNKLDKLNLLNQIKQHNIDLNENQIYDVLYLINMCISDFLGSSIKDEEHLYLYVKDVLTDVDGYDDLVFTRWCADMSAKNININWKEYI